MTCSILKQAAVISFQQLARHRSPACQQIPRLRPAFPIRPEASLTLGYRTPGDFKNQLNANTSNSNSAPYPLSFSCLSAGVQSKTTRILIKCTAVTVICRRRQRRPRPTNARPGWRSKCLRSRSCCRLGTASSDWQCYGPSISERAAISDQRRISLKTYPNAAVSTSKPCPLQAFSRNTRPATFLPAHAK
jgi:hypothetical protein